MYAYKNGVYTNDDCSIHKTIRFKPEVIKVVENAPGKNFSEKLHNIISEYEKEKCSTKS